MQGTLEAVVLGVLFLVDHDFLVSGLQVLRSLGKRVFDLELRVSSCVNHLLFR